MRNEANQRLFFLLTVLLLIFHVAANGLYLGEDLNIEQKDVAAHLKLHTKFHLQLRDILRNTSSPWGLVRDCVSLFHQDSMEVEHIWIWPRLIYAVATPMTALFGLTPRVIIFSNSVWLAVLIFSVYLIGRASMSPTAGFLAAFVASFLPITYGMSRQFGLDFPMMAMVALNIYWLMRTDYFSRRDASLLFGCALGLGLLVKVQLVIFMCGPMAFSLIVGIARSRRKLRDAGDGEVSPRGRSAAYFTNVLIAILCATLLSSLFWWGNLENLADVFIKHTSKIEEFGQVDMDEEYLASFFLSPQYFSYYAVVAIIYLSPVFFALSLILLPSFWRSRFHGKAFILLWAVVPYIIWTIIEVKYDIYYIGSLPAFAVIIGAGIAAVKKKPLKAGLTAIVVAWGLFHFFNLSFSCGSPPYKNCRLFSAKSVREDGYTMWVHPAFENDLEDVAGTFISKIDSLEPENDYVRIGILEFEHSERDYRLVDCLEYFMESRNPNIYVYRSFFSPDSFLECMDSFNFIIVLEKGSKEKPDFKTFEGYFLEKYGVSLCEKYLENTATFLRLSESYRKYEVLGADFISPANISAFLLRKPACTVDGDTVIPATYISSANVYIAYPRIGIDDTLRHTPTIGDYDVLFPYDIEFPLVPPRRRNESEPYFARYRIDVGNPGRYALFILPGTEGWSGLRAEYGGLSLKRDTGSSRHGGPEGSFYLGEFRAGRGEGRLTLKGEERFPIAEALSVLKVGDE